MSPPHVEAFKTKEHTKKCILHTKFSNILTKQRIIKEGLKILKFILYTPLKLNLVSNYYLTSGLLFFIANLYGKQEV